MFGQRGSATREALQAARKKNLCQISLREVPEYGKNFLGEIRLSEERSGIPAFPEAFPWARLEMLQAAQEENTAALQDLPILGPPCSAQISSRAIAGSVDEDAEREGFMGGKEFFDGLRGCRRSLQGDCAEPAPVSAASLREGSQRHAGLS